MTDSPVTAPIPQAPEAEKSVVGQLLGNPKLIGPVLSTGLEPQHFYSGPARALFHEVVSAYFADDPIDPLTIAELTAKALSRAWAVDEQAAIRRVEGLANQHRGQRNAVEHAKIVKRHADYRAILDLSDRIRLEVEREQDSPEEIAGLLSQDAMRIATSTLLQQDLVGFEDLGRQFVKDQRTLMAAREQGIELGAYFGLSFLDSFTRGLRPSELMFLAGEPGAGKSAVSWKAGMMFAERQLRKPKEKQVGTLVLSLEMAEEPSSTRVAQTMTKMDGGKLREGRTDKADLQQVIEAWKKRRELPIWFNFSSNMRASQLRALTVEAIRRHNVGLIIVDHFKYLDMDGRWRSDLEQEEAKARFLKQDVATQLNVAVMCLAHTTKAIESRDDRRPKLSDLRGSGQVAAHADFVAFVHRPYNSAKQADIDAGTVKRTDAELIWAKNRHGLEGAARFHFDASRMDIY